MNLTPSAEQLTLERLKIAATGHIPRYILEQGEVAQWEDYFVDTVMMQFRSEVLAKTLGTEEVTRVAEHDVPASWWQMFKATYALTWWLAWFVARWPVRLEQKRTSVSVSVANTAVFPDATVRFPKELGNPIIVNRVVS